MGTSTFGYAYDPIGNRTASASNTTAWTYAANELNQYTAVTGLTASLRYDLDGNLTNDSQYAYTWDAENRLIAVALTGTSTLSVGNRTFKHEIQHFYDRCDNRTWSDQVADEVRSSAGVCFSLLCGEMRAQKAAGRCMEPAQCAANVVNGPHWWYSYSCDRLLEGWQPSLGSGETLRDYIRRLLAARCPLDDVAPIVIEL